jgi:glucokinase
MSRRTKMNTLIGLDLGGTKIAGILVNSEHDIVTEVKVRTKTRDQATLVSCIKSTIDRLYTAEMVPGLRLTGIGVGVAGHVDYDEGRVLFSPNLPIENLNLRAILETEYDVPVFIDNDANAAALGEKHFGQAKENKNFICVTLGTGIGAGVFIGGKIYRGSVGGAGELGHLILDCSPDAPICGCKNRGCFEALASGIAIARRAREIFAREDITAHDVTKMARKGNRQALKILEQAAEIIGIGFANIVNLFNPEKIVVTGSLCEAEELILKPAIRTMMERAFSTNAKAVTVVKSSLNNRAGVLGAAALAMQSRAQH